MAKKQAKPSPAASTVAPGKKGRKLKLILAGGLTLVLAGGGYAGWTVFAAPGEAAMHGAEADAHAPPAITPEAAAETSFTYSFALSELLKRTCGEVEVAALKAASEAEAAADGMLVNLSWMAANRRLETITEKSCNGMLVEIDSAQRKAADAAPKPAGATAEHH